MEEKEKRTVKKDVRYSKEELLVIEEKAKKAGLSFSDFTRKMLIDGQVNVIDPEHKRTMYGIANNLNQIARIANASKAIPSDLMEVLKSLQVEFTAYAGR